jgi:hypothetical protein
MFSSTQLSRHLFRTILLVLLVSCFGVAAAVAEDRTFDGTGNNLEHPEWGSAGSNFARHAASAYLDGTSIPRISGQPNPRAVSNALFRQVDSVPNRRRLSGYVYTFGQFISHDMQQTVSGGTESIGFRIPDDDEMFLPRQLFPLTRSVFDPDTGTSPANPREQVNFTTAFIDGSVVYGSDERTASILRGGPANAVAKLRTSNDINGDGQNLLPRDAFGPFPPADFVAGDSRVNDTIVLTVMQTLFMREHNRLVDQLAASHPQWSHDALYQRARKIVGAQLQAVTYNEFLPALLGPHSPARTGTYHTDVDPTILNEFPTVFLRVGHSMLTNELKRLDNHGQPTDEGPLPLENAFFDPTNLTTSEQLDAFLKGLSHEVQEETDLQLVDGMRLALLGAIDIQRARDHGIGDYNTLREAYGLSRVTSFAEITSNTNVQRALEAVYPDIDAIDPFVGAIAEDHLPGASVGPLVAAGYIVQFNSLRDGDRFWYQVDTSFTAEEIQELQQTRLSDIIRRNTNVANLQDNVFLVPEPRGAFLVALVLALVTRHRSPASSPVTRKQHHDRAAAYDLSRRH